MAGCGNGEKGKRHVIICRSPTSPVNPRSCLTWLIKEAIKGPPPEIFERRRERGRRKPAREIERGPRLREGKGRRGNMGKKSVVIFVIVSYVNRPSSIPGWGSHTPSLSILCLVFCLHKAITLWSFLTFICRAQIAVIYTIRETTGTPTKSSALVISGWSFWKLKWFLGYIISDVTCSHQVFQAFQHETPSRWQPRCGSSGLTLCNCSNLPHVCSFYP